MADSTAKKIRKVDPIRTASFEVLQYGLKITYNTLMIIIFSLLIGIVLNKTHEVIISMLSFALLRFFSGGFHLKSSDRCVALSVSMILLIAFTNFLPDYLYEYINFLTLLVLLKFAPSNIHIKTKKSFNQKFVFKSISLILVITNITLIGNQIIAVAFFIQSLTTIYNRSE
ncbi:accessory gene regulator B family protein [Paenibacillus sp. N1-5-1-14]|uniref:accessory gene regulator B family protein n=1 Tax=Paenibacillus radicibacter TaxID=2972488 RepID=UPI0021596B06|nr:accessory gene regulator B family protein [Paenibacillus radicibacter]MCR8641456.1 accessory gene regulator B family protein [Paenibacillus radicibacter]